MQQSLLWWLGFDIDFNSFATTDFSSFAAKTKNNFKRTRGTFLLSLKTWSHKLSLCSQKLLSQKSQKRSQKLLRLKEAENWQKINNSG